MAPRLVPVDYDPFAESHVTFTPVDYDPFDVAQVAERRRRAGTLAPADPATVRAQARMDERNRGVPADHERTPEDNRALNRIAAGHEQVGDRPGVYARQNAPQHERELLSNIDAQPQDVRDTMAFISTIRHRLTPQEFPWLYRIGQPQSNEISGQAQPVQLTEPEIADIITRSHDEIAGMSPADATRYLFGNRNVRPDTNPAASLGQTSRPPRFQADARDSGLGAEAPDPITGRSRRERANMYDTTPVPVSEEERQRISEQRTFNREVIQQRLSRFGEEGPGFAGGMGQYLLGMTQRVTGGMAGALGTVLDDIGSVTGQDTSGAHYLQNLGRYMGERGLQRETAATPNYQVGSPQWYAFQGTEALVEMGGAFAAAAGTKNPALITSTMMGLRVFGEQYDDSVRQGRAPNQALIDGIAYGLFEMIPENMALHSIWRPGQRFLLRTVRGVAAEGAQEMATETLQTLWDAGVLHQDMDWAQVKQRILSAGVLGGIVGGPVGVAGHGMEHLGARRDARSARQAEIDAAAVTALNPNQADPSDPNNIASLRSRAGMESPLTPRTGIKEAAATAPPNVTPEDVASPLPTDLIAAGKSAIDDVLAGAQADHVLDQNIGHQTGDKVTVTIGGQERTGTIKDAFQEDDPETGTHHGAVIEWDHGGQSRERFSDLADAGARIARRPRDTGHRVANDVVEYLMRNGIREDIAHGIAAGVAAESGNDHGVRNAASGALGLGQWLGTRQAELHRRYGPNPTRQQQLEFLVWELRGGDPGGAAVLNSRNPGEALDNYIRHFMRPAAGAETTGDLARGQSALRGAGVDVGDLATADAGPAPDFSWIDRPVDQAGAPESVSPIQSVETTNDNVEGDRGPAIGDGTRAAPIEATTAEHVDLAAAQAHPEPTEAQIDAGNYPHGHVRVQGLDISIENARGSERRGVGPDGEPWSVTMPSAYGYLRRTEGQDGEQVDVYVGDHPTEPTVYVIDQVHADTKAPDEHKAMIGFPSEEAALATYHQAFSDGKGPDRVGAVTPMDMPQFKEWLKGDTTVPAAENVPATPAQQTPVGETAPEATGQPAPETAAPAAFDAEQHVEAMRAYVANSTGSLNDTEKMGKALGLTSEQTNRVMGALAAQSKTSVTVERNVIAIRGANEAALGIIRAALPARARPMQRSDGAFTLPKKYEGIVRSALAKPTISLASSPNENAARNERDAGISGVVRDEAPVPMPERQKLPSVRRKGRDGSPSVDERLPSVSEGDRAASDAATHSGSDRRNEGLRAGERPLGDEEGAKSESSGLHSSDNVSRENDVSGGVGQENRPSAIDDNRPSESRGRSGESVVEKENPSGKQRQNADASGRVSPDESMGPAAGLEEGASGGASAAGLDSGTRLDGAAETVANATRPADVSAKSENANTSDPVEAAKAVLQNALDALNGKTPEAPVAEAAPAETPPATEPSSITETPAFKAWFGDSKVVDENGEPLVVYHGTEKEFDSFDAARQGSGALGAGFYFAEDRGAAEDAGENILSVYLKVESPLILSRLTEEERAEWNELFESDPTGAQDRARREGFDGILDDVYTDRNWVAFEPTQIKSTENLGTFDPADSRTLFQRGPSVDRRTFIKGVTAVAGGFMVGDRLFAQPPGLMSILERSINEAVPLTEPLEWIAQNSENAQFRRFARRMIPLVNGIVIRGAEQGTTTHRDGTRVPEDISEGLAHGMHQTDEITDGDVIWLGRGALVNGFNEGTLMHEGLHAAIYRMFGRLSVRMGGNDPALLRREGFRREATPRPASAAQIEQVRGLYQEAVSAYEKMVESLPAGEERSDRIRHIRNGLGNPDEFLSYALENRDMQGFLREQPAQGARGQKTLWDKIVDFIRRLFGMGDTPRSALNDVLDTGYRLLADPQGPTSETNQVVENPTAVSFDRGSTTGRQLLQRDGSDPTKSPAFKTWFGDSKVVDENGEPLVVYHGTDASFDAFDPVAEGIDGIFFSSSREIGDDYAGWRSEGGQGKVYAAYLSTQNPRIVEGVEDFSADLFQDLIDEAKDQGHDGVIFRNVRDGFHRSEVVADTFVAFEPTQIKSVDNRGTFDPNDSRHRYSLFQRQGDNPNNLFQERPSATLWNDVLNRSRDLTGAAKTIGARDKIAEAFDGWRINFQDRVLSFLRTETAIEQVIGRELTDEERLYQSEALYTGRVGDQFEKLADDIVEPMFEAMQESKINADELESYLYARHAPSRNAKMQKEGVGDGSGMSDIQAAAIMSRIEKAGKTGALENVAKWFDKLTAFALDTRTAGGLMTQDQADEWRSQWEHYAPLKGHLELPEEERPNLGGKGFTVKGPESKRAFGRKSQATDIIAHTIVQAQEAVVRAEKNRVWQALYNLAKANPDENFWKINPVTMKKRINKDTGLVETYPVTNVVAEDVPYTTNGKVNGKAYRITFNRHNPAAVKMAEAMRRTNEPELNFRIFQIANQWLSKANTTLSPDFIVSNIARDLETATANLSQFDMKNLRRDVLASWPKAFAAAERGAFKREGDSEWDQAWRDYSAEGGRISFNQTESVEQLQKDITKRFARIQANSLSPKEAGLKAWEGLKWTFDKIEKANMGAENATRLSVYKNLVDRGVSKKKAAFIAKEITTNFNRRGVYGALVNSLYLFANAGIQGNTRMILALKHRRTQKIAGSMIVAGALVAMFNAAMGGDDDDGVPYYDKISEFEKQSNLIFMIPGSGGRYIKIPMAYGYSVFPDLGRQMVDVVRGRTHALDAAGSWLNNALNSFNPIGGQESIANFLAPTVVDPAVDLFVDNRDFANRPIMPDQSPYGPPIPDSQRYWPSIPPYYRALTDALNRGTGGTQVESGGIDVSPETLQYMVQQATGSAGATLSRLGSVVTKTIDGDPETNVEINDIPVARRLVGQKPTWYDQAAFYQRLRSVQDTVAQAREYRRLGDREGQQRFVAEHRDVIALRAAANQAQTEMQNIRRARAQADIKLANGQITQARHDQIRATAHARQERLFAAFNRRYLELVRDPIQPQR